MMDKNTIPERQNEETALKLMRARQWTYHVANWLMGLQILLTVLIPIVGSVFTIFVPDARPYFAAVALVVLVLDTTLLDRQYKALIKRGAKLGEKFDCFVLELPWNSFVAGDEPEADDIRAASRSWSRGHDDSRLKDWYPIAVSEMPLGLGRIVCQRTNLRYDSKLRRSFGGVILGMVIVVLLGLLAIGLAQNLNLTAWILTFAPATPLLTWSGREFYRQRDTAEQLEDLIKLVRRFWNRALAGDCDSDACARESREFQNAIYLRRSTSPLIMPFLYKIKRWQLEDEMNEAANNFLDQYQKKQKGCSTRLASVSNGKLGETALHHRLTDASDVGSDLE